MLKLPHSLKTLIEELSELPSIGPRQATRLAFHLIGKGKQSIATLAGALEKLEDIKICERCFFIHENQGALCDICADPMRDQKIIMLVEKETDLISLEETKKFPGRYFILGVIPKTGILEDAQKFRLQALKSFIQRGFGEQMDSTHSTSSGQASSPQAEEIILAFNPTSVGDWNASVLKKELEPLAKKITRLGRGLPTGGEIEFADDETLEGALSARS